MKNNHFITISYKEDWSSSDRDKLLGFLTIQALECDDELASTHGTLHKTFLEGELYALDRVRLFVKENIDHE